jgi:hypothetical protein
VEEDEQLGSSYWGLRPLGPPGDAFAPMAFGQLLDDDPFHDSDADDSEDGGSGDGGDSD